MSLTTKELSRQKQLWFSLIIIAVMAIGSMALLYVDKEVSQLAGIVSGIAVALAGIVGVNLASKPGGGVGNNAFDDETYKG